MGRGESYDRCRGNKSYCIFVDASFRAGNGRFLETRCKSGMDMHSNFIAWHVYVYFHACFDGFPPPLFPSSFVSFFFFFFRSISKHRFNVIYKQISRMKCYAKTNRSRRVYVYCSKINLLFFFVLFRMRIRRLRIFWYFHSCFLKYFCCCKFYQNLICIYIYIEFREAKVLCEIAAYPSSFPTNGLRIP